ncbi:hypothetical protein [Campylobacter corcagiensis]|uniref:PIN-like domain-containing protein n=1 Tax=Campylobacter corcagiensis TaxID=1448857 RepID=A0A7M1LDG8_9BACT|nr:hypothetical protein [Campylobacter corcagiensis]QKF65265.1 hypothetical protein CCORG_1423 [Campylobacter corcagiensis]QOQ86602.1 hypothetical protein IMC76_05045 [Campylobacter corcagiensis]
MRVFLIDAENVNIEFFIKSREFKKSDKFYIVVYNSLKFSIDVLKFLQDREFFVYEFKNPSENYADKIIFTILGYIMNDPKFSHFYIVSNDHIFVNLGFTERLFGKKVENIKFSNSTSLVATKSSFEPKKAEPNIDEIYKNNIEDIEILRQSYPKNDEFHNALVKLFGMDIGKNLYKISKNTTKDKNEIFYQKNRAKIDEILKQNNNLKDTHNALVKEFGEVGKELYNYLKNSKVFLKS